MDNIKLFIFDIDGVLCSSKKLHEISFILALNKFGYNITEDFHKEKLDGLPTLVKLGILNVKESEIPLIFNEKQRLTFQMANDFIVFSQEKFELFREIKDRNKKIAVCSNSIRDFSKIVLQIMKLDGFVDLLLSNEDVTNPKPNPEIYLKCMNSLGVSPIDSVIFEDSKFGLDAAFKSMSNVCYIKNPDYLERRVKLWL